MSTPGRFNGGPHRHLTADEAWDLSFLGALPAHVQTDLRSSALGMTIPPGHIIYRNDDHARLVLIVSGRARIVASSPEGRKATIRYARSADCVGSMSVVTRSQPVMAQAITEAEVLFINVDRLRRFAHTEPEVGWQLAQFVGTVATQVIEMMTAALFGSVRQRLAQHLLDLSVHYDDRLIVVVDQQEIADAIGSVREVIARTLKEFRERNLISRTPNGLQLDNPDELHAIALGA
ncbi:Crp/Fnr family transcriptional regulator [Jongsikchunia kroppenstedtii]|uniref:Crp/Fnr family transcriptional regulator n=1 Tax=Jongsikchunia kroppenstedtii TaxID=1121721 RepID=UPI000373EFE1|nr:Crp/Fnr family transcriptional regulator [Jongsikchunia kroppenstedtii]